MKFANKVLLLFLVLTWFVVVNCEPVCIHVPLLYNYFKYPK